MDKANWIAGLMRLNTNELGFIPITTIHGRYIRKDQYVLQHDERGKRIGYMLYGALHPGRTVSIAQHCIELDKRLNGYGLDALEELERRCALSQVTSIKLRCGTDMESLAFWQHNGFEIQRIEPGGLQRKRQIAVMYKPLSLPLLAIP